MDIFDYIGIEVFQIMPKSHELGWYSIYLTTNFLKIWIIGLGDLTSISLLFERGQTLV